MSKIEFEELNKFDANVVALDQRKIDIPDKFAGTFGAETQKKIIEGFTPKIGGQALETALDVNKVNIQTQGNIAVNLDPKRLYEGSLLDLKDKDASSALDLLKSASKDSSIFNSDAFKFLPDSAKRMDAAFDDQMKAIGESGKTAEEMIEEGEAGEELMEGMYAPEVDLSGLYDPVKKQIGEWGGDAWDYLFGPKHDISKLSTTGPYDVSKGLYATQIPTGLKTTSAQTSIGLSGPPPASLAGRQAGDITNISSLATAGASAFANIGLAVPAGVQTGLQTFTTLGSAGAVPFQTGLGTGTSGTAGATAARSLGQLASVWGIYEGIKSGTGQGYMNAALSTAALINPALAIPVAIITGLQALFGMRRRGRPKFPFGGTEFKTEGNKLTFKHPYGYNGFNGGVARAGAASVADYVNTFVNYFGDYTGQGLQFNSGAWKNAVKKDPRLGRYDTMNDSGYADPSVLIRKVLEAPGVITGTPMRNGMPVNDQQQYEQEMKGFNTWYTKTAIERGGVANRQWLNTKEEPNMFGENWAGQYGKVPDQIHHRTRGEFLYERGRGGLGQTPDPVYRWHESYEDVKSPYDTLYYNITGKFNRGEGGMGY